jgi:hypothetical protein
MKKLSLFFILCTFIFAACKKKHEEPVPQPTTGILSGKISNSSGVGINGAQVIVFNANTNTPVAVITTGITGSYSIELPIGTYFVKVYSQGNQSVPPLGLPAIPFTISGGLTTTHDVQMVASTITNAGSISGKVTVSAVGKSGVLVVAHVGMSGYSSISDANGTYNIFNVPANSGYVVNAYVIGFNSDSTQNVTVNSGQNTANIDLHLTGGASGIVSGAITFLATANKQVDVSLANPYTRESIPGLSTRTNGQNYTLTNVPSGFYLARASYGNDTIVIDPDWIFKFGIPYVTVNGGSVSRDFSVTDAVILNSPTNSPTFIFPVSSGASPTFTWSAYPSTSQYALELTDESGTVIWGGFTGSGTTLAPVKATTTTSFVYDGAALSSGSVYQWKVYALKATTTAPYFKFISASEDQMGLITP